MRRIHKQKRKQKRVELEPIDSEFNPTRSKVEEDKITETLSAIDKTLSHLNRHTW